MKMRSPKMQERVALLLVGSAILLCSCEEQKTVEPGSLNEKLMTEYSENRRVIATENGRKSYEFFTPLLEGYTAGREPYREFRKGVEITTFKKDSTAGTDVTLTANYAIYYQNRKLWEAKGNVVVRKSDGKELYTEQLFWNALTKKIYSNVDSKIVQPDGSISFVSSFESDEEFRYWSSRDMDLRMEVEFKPTEPAEAADSAAVDKPAAPQPAPARPRADAPSQTSRPTPVRHSAPEVRERTARPESSSEAVRIQANTRLKADGELRCKPVGGGEDETAPRRQ